MEEAKPHIVLTDIRMPGRSGIEFAREILANHPTVRVILITGHHRFEYAHAALKLSISEFLLKPTDPEEIVAAVARERDTVLKTLGYGLWGGRFKTRNENVLRVIESIYVRYADRSLALGHLATEIGLHPDHLSRLFRQETATTFSSLLSEYRLAQAKRLLETTDYRISEVADAVGFRDSHHLAHRFRDVFGETPSTYRIRARSAGERR
jgi:YesN/AraC family two-component response regulator